jgi:hypothetical protein
MNLIDAAQHAQHMEYIIKVTLIAAGIIWLVFR